jgi:FkbM family methyltransferase
MIKYLIGKLGLAYALKAPNHRGKFRFLNLLDHLFGPFVLHNSAEQFYLTVYLSSSMDTSYFRNPTSASLGKISGKSIDEVTPLLVKALRLGDVFVDIGANIGFLSIMASKRVGASGLVVAIEPSSREYGRLLANLTRNRVGNIIPIHAALGEESSIVDLEIAPHHTGLNRLSVGGAQSDCYVKVPMFFGSGLLSKLLPMRTPALVKIDVEGAEVLVLRGLKDYLMKTQPANVVVEVTPHFLARHDTTKEELYGIMAGIGYRPLFNFSETQFDEVFRPESHFKSNPTQRGEIGLQGGL